MHHLIIRVNKPLNAVMKNHLLKIVALTLLLKVAYFLFGILATQCSTKHRVEFSSNGFLSLFKRNDSFWYEKAADLGYPRITNPLDLGYSYGKYYKQSVWAFLPAYPLSVRFIEQLFKLDFDQSAFLLSLVFSMSSFIAFYLLCLHVNRFSREESYLYTCCFMLFPFNYYQSMYYTEAFFFACMAFSFVSIASKNYLMSSLLFVPLPLLRPNGIACLLPLFIYFVETEGGFKKIVSDIKTGNRSSVQKSLYFITGPLALGIYCLYQKQMTGHYFAFLKAQSGWYKEFMFPLLGLFRRSDLATQFNSVYAILFMVVAILAGRKLSFSQNVFIWIGLLLPLASGSATGMPRYISMIFPLIIYVSSFLINTKWRYPMLVGFFIIQLVTFYPWIISDPFSY